MLSRRTLAFFAMFAVALLFRADTPVTWDDWEYAARAIRGWSTSLALGRWWFVVVMRWSYQLGHALFGLTPLRGYLAMQIASSLMMAGALVALMAWTYRLTKSSTAELLVAALVLPGPLVGLYASAVMTESMALLLITVAFLAWENALVQTDHDRRARVFAVADRAWFWALLGGLVFGIAIDIREPAALFCAWPIISCVMDRPSGRWKLLAIAFAGTCTTFAIGIIGAWTWSPRADGYWTGVLEWAADMTSDRQRNPINLLENGAFFAAWCLAAMPVAAALTPIAAVWAIVRRNRFSWLALAMVPYLVANLANHTLVENPRFSIPFMWVLSPVVAAAIGDLIGQSRSRLRAALIAVLVFGAIDIAIGWRMIRMYYFDLVDSHKQVLQSLLSIPQQSGPKPVIVAGTSTPVVSFLVEIGARDFEIIYGGWAWPRGKVAQIIADDLRRGADVYVNFETSAALRSVRDTGEWDELIEAASKYAWDHRSWPLVRLLPPSSEPGRQ